MAHNLSDLRMRINEIDSQLAHLIEERMNVISQVAYTKHEQGIPVFDAEREATHKADIVSQASVRYRSSMDALWTALMDVSKDYQRQLLAQDFYGLIGEKLSHSYSPHIHGMLGSYPYMLEEVVPKELDTFLAQTTLRGFNVTIPYKIKVFNRCGTLSDQALRIGCVNTVLKDEAGILHGFNTDYAGFKYLLEHHNISVTGKSVAILGTGGASQTVRTVVKDLGAAFVVHVSRNPERALLQGACGDVDCVSYESNQLASAQVIINTTPVGMFPHVGVSPLNLIFCEEAEAVVDLIYNPLRTALVIQAEQRGLKAIGGLDMLVAQAYEAARVWGVLDEACPTLEEMCSCVADEKEHIILIGMPGCGKSTLGLRLAEELGRPFIDIDAVIEAQQGRSIPDIFAREGEDYFRVCEHEACLKVVQNPAAVIATGGGVVMHPDNYDVLRSQGDLIYVMRDLSHLSLEGRPLSQKHGIGELAAVRLPLYEKWAQETVTNDGTVEEAVHSLIEVVHTMNACVFK